MRSRTTIPQEFAALNVEAFRLSAGEKVAIVTDVIASENSVRRAIAEVTSRAAEPLVIACLLDGRSIREPVDVMGRQVPIASLANFDLYHMDRDEISPINIDPVTRDDEVPQGSTFDYPIPPSDFLRICEAHPGVVRLGHIERPVAGHFSVYVDAVTLLSEDPTFAKTIVDQIVDSVEAWWAELGLAGPPKRRPVDVWYPLTSDDLAQELTLAVKRRLVATGHPVHTRSVPRVGAGSDWTFPLQLRPLEPTSDVLIIDWRALAGVTLPQMMRLAADSGARTIHCAVVLSHLDYNAEGVLRQVSSLLPVSSTTAHNGRAVNGGEASKGEVAARHVPTVVRFTTWVGSGRFQPPWCPICHERDRYADDAKAAPTELLRRHAVSAHLALQPHPRDALGEELRDLYDVRVTPEEVTAFINVRTQLQSALRLTSEREYLRCRLQSLVAEVGAARQLEPLDDGDPSDQAGTETRDGSHLEVDAWIRVLAAERQWLRLPPLRYGTCRALVAELASQVVIDSADQVKAIGIRRQALVVLSTAQPDTFAASIPSLFRRCQADPELVDDLLYETYAYLRRWVSQSRQQLPMMLEGLKYCQDLVDQARQDGRFDEKQVLDYSHTLGSLRRMAESHLHYAGHLSAQEAWLLLRQGYQESIARHNDELHLWIDEVAVTVQESPERSSAWASALQSWQLCQDFLARNVVRFLPPVRDILLSERYIGLLTADAHDWFMKLLNEPDRRLGVAADLLLRLAKDPQLASDTAVIDECEREVTNWIDFFLSAGGGGVRRARLLDILSRCPCDLDKAIDAAVAAARLPSDVLVLEKDPSCGSVSEVFCDGELLKAAFSHLIGNIVKRADPDWGQRHRLYIAAEVDEPNQRVTVSVKNDGTVPSDTPGHGYATLNKGLSAFGCRLSRGPGVERPWTYEARLQLPLTRAETASAAGVRS